MQKQLKTKVPTNYWLDKLYTHGTFTHIKLELEGNQDDYDVDMDENDDESLSDFLCALFDRAELDSGDFDYIYSYNDGSVNTEVTLTTPLTEEGVAICARTIAAFNRCIENTRNAGMHITLLGDNAYTSEEAQLSTAGVRNLKEQIAPILPFIQLLGQSSNLHRGSYFCSNRVGDSKVGYPAVYIQDEKRIEFRFFHPCYDKPELLEHYLEVISRIIEYYDNPAKKVRLHGSPKTYEQLLSTDEFDYLACNSRRKVLPDTLAFSDIFSQFTGAHVGQWQKATGFQPKTLPQQWADKEYREALRAHNEVKSALRPHFSRDAANWLMGDKSALYDELNRKKLRAA